MVSKSTIIVRYVETDQMGIAHHSNYPIWFEVARTDYIKRIQMTYSEMEGMGILMPLVSLSCRFEGAAHYEDELTVEVKIKTLTPAKIEFEYTIYKKEIKKPIHHGFTMHAWTDENLKPFNLKKRYPKLYEAIENAM